MQNKSNDFSMQDALRLAKSPAGQQLLALLKQTDSSRLQQAAEQAGSGNMEQAKLTLSQLLASPQVQKLLEELGRQS